MQFNPSMIAQLGMGATAQNQATPQQMSPAAAQGMQRGILPDGPPDPGRVQMIGRFQMQPQPQP